METAYRRPKGKPATWGRSPELWMETLSTSGREISMAGTTSGSMCASTVMARAMQWRLRFGTAIEGDTCFNTYFYSSNAAKTVKYLAIKKAETQQRWKVAADMQTEVEGRLAVVIWCVRCMVQFVLLCELKFKDKLILSFFLFLCCFTPTTKAELNREQYYTAETQQEHPNREQYCTNQRTTDKVGHLRLTIRMEILNPNAIITS